MNEMTLCNVRPGEACWVVRKSAPHPPDLGSPLHNQWAALLLAHDDAARALHATVVARGDPTRRRHRPCSRTRRRSVRRTER